jgi:hypothetical protein
LRENWPFLVTTSGQVVNPISAEADHVKDPRCVTRRTHARFTDLIVHFRMDWRSVCRGIDGSCWVACGGIVDSCSVCAGVGGSRFGALCAIDCFGAPLVGARDFLGFRPLLFGMDPTPDHRNARSIMLRLSSSLSRQDGREGSGLSRASACGPHEAASCSVGDSATLVRADRRLWVRRVGRVLLDVTDEIEGRVKRLVVHPRCEARDSVRTRMRLVRLARYRKP